MAEGPSDSSLRVYDDVAGRVHMHLSCSERVALIVEGPSDRDALSGMAPRADIFIAGKREEVLRTGDKLFSIGEARYLCIFDNDFEAELDLESLPWLLPYEGADLESMLLDLGCGASLLQVHVVPERLDEAGGVNALYALLRDLAAEVGAIRECNRAENWELPFSQVPCGEFIVNYEALDRFAFAQRLILKARSNSPSSDTVEQVIIDHIVGLDIVAVNRKFRGRDLLDITSKFLKSTKYKAKAKVSTTPQALEASLHIAAPAYLASSQWGHNLLRAMSERLSTH